jgi:hypothetical protein
MTDLKHADSRPFAGHWKHGRRGLEKRLEMDLHSGRLSIYTPDVLLQRIRKLYANESAGGHCNRPGGHGCVLVCAQLPGHGYFSLGQGASLHTPPACLGQRCDPQRGLHLGQRCQRSARSQVLAVRVELPRHEPAALHLLPVLGMLSALAFQPPCSGHTDHLACSQPSSRTLDTPQQTRSS